MEHPPLTLAFAELSDIFGTAVARPRETERMHAASATAHAPQRGDGLPAPYGVAGLRAALQQRGIAADGPALNATAAGAALDPIARRRGPRLRSESCSTPRLSDLLLRRPTLADRPRPRRSNWGQRVPGGVTMAGIDYQAYRRLSGARLDGRADGSRRGVGRWRPSRQSGSCTGSITRSQGSLR